MKLFELIMPDRKLVKWLAPLTLTSILAYIVNWQHGLYSDDYVLQANSTIELFQTVIRERYRILGMAEYRLVYLLGEFSARVFAVVALLLTAYLAATLIYRITKSELGAALSMWIIAMPIFSEHVVTWISAVPYIVASLLTLLSLATFWSASMKSSPYNKYTLASILIFVCATLSLEQSVNFLIYFPFLTYIITNIHTKDKTSKAAVQTLVLSISGILLLLGTSFVLLYKSSDSVQKRGGITITNLLNPDLLLNWFNRTLGLIFTTDYARTRLALMFELGRNAVFDRWFASILLSTTVLMIICLIATWSPSENAQTGHQHRSGSNRLHIILFALSSCLVIISSLYIPGLILSNQLLQYRMLYFPWLGVALLIGALIALLEGIVKGTVMHRLLGRVFIAIGSTWLVFSGVTLLGFTEFYKMRHNLDQLQINAIYETIPRNLLPPEQEFHMVAYNQYEDVLGYPHVLNRYALGVLETHWSATSVLKNIYHLDNVKAITNDRWGASMSFANPEPGNEQPAHLIINGKAIARDKLILYTYLRPNTVDVYTSIEIVYDDKRSDVIMLPLAEHLAMNGVRNGGALVYQP